MKLGLFLRIYLLLILCIYCSKLSAKESFSSFLNPKLYMNNSSFIENKDILNYEKSILALSKSEAILWRVPMRNFLLKQHIDKQESEEYIKFIKKSMFNSLLANDSRLLRSFDMSQHGFLQQKLSQIKALLFHHNKALNYIEARDYLKYKQEQVQKDLSEYIADFHGNSSRSSQIIATDFLHFREFQTYFIQQYEKLVLEEIHNSFLKYPLGLIG